MFGILWLLTALAFAVAAIGALFSGVLCVLSWPEAKIGLLVIWASTLTTKQHYVVDGVAGLLLAVGVWALFYARPAAVKRLTSA